jgi:hypothetical protein
MQNIIALYEKIDKLLAFEPRWFIWSEVDKQIFENLPLLQEYESELRDILEKVKHDIQFLEVQDTVMLTRLRISIETKLKDVDRKMKEMEKMRRFFKYSGKNI